MAFTLIAHRWYGWQMLPGYVDGDDYDPFTCPCRLSAVSPKKSGKGDLDLNVWVTGYVDGVNMGDVPLRVLFRGDSYLVAQIHYPDALQVRRCVVINEMNPRWLERYCPAIWREIADDWKGDECTDKLQFHIERFFCPAIPWYPDISCEEVIMCALRFDGARLDREWQEGPSQSTYEALSRNHDRHFARQPWRLHEDPLVNWGEFYWLQRSEKWCSLDHEGAILTARLFVALHDHEPPEDYEVEEFSTKYSSLRAGAIAQAALWKRMLTVEAQCG